MHKLVMIFAMTTAMLFAGSLIWKAEAQTWRGAASINSASENYTPIEKAACRGYGRFCGPGYTRACDAFRCWCRRCW